MEGGIEARLQHFPHRFFTIPFYLFRALEPTISLTTSSCVSRKEIIFEDRLPELPLSSWSGSPSTSLEFLSTFSLDIPRRARPPSLVAHPYSSSPYPNLYPSPPLLTALPTSHGSAYSYETCLLPTVLPVSNGFALVNQPERTSSPGHLGIYHCLFTEFFFSPSRVTSNYLRVILSHHADSHDE